MFGLLKTLSSDSLFVIETELFSSEEPSRMFHSVEVVPIRS